jgi:hypothetical protein
MPSSLTTFSEFVTFQICNFVERLPKESLVIMLLTTSSEFAQKLCVAEPKVSLE